MNNKKINRQIAAPETDLEIVYEQIHKNKEDIELFYAKNKMKFPPILQSKNIVFMHLLPEYVDLAPMENQPKKINKEQNRDKSPSLQKMGSKQLMEKQPSICNIEFSKPYHQKNRYMNHRKSRSNQFTPNTFKTISQTPKRCYISEQKSMDLKFLNEPGPQDQTIQNFFEKFNKNRVNDKKNTFILTKSFEGGKKSKSKHTEPLSINKISTQNPEITLLNGKKLSIDSQRREKKLKIQNNFSLENSKEQNNIFRRRKVSYRKQAGYFQPWQQESLLEDDYFGDLRR